MPANQTRHFVIRHDLASLEFLPNYVWNTGIGEAKIPRRYKEILPGSKWVSYAYTSTDYSADRLRFVTGFFSCVTPYQYGNIPVSLSDLRRYDPKCPSSAWLIRGEPDGMEFENRVLVPSIDYFFDKKKWARQAITPITKEEYERIRKYVCRCQISLSEIPLFGREPESEQELLAIFVNVHELLGVKRILRVQQGFPDLTVELEGVAHPVQIELELYSQSYISHGHPKDSRVAVLCWLNDDPREKGDKVRNLVHNVYELRELFRHKRKIIW